LKKLSDFKINLLYRNIIIIVFGVILLIASIFIYKDNKKDVFMDEYMEDIFVYANSEVSKEENVVKEIKNTFYVEIKGEVIYPDVYEMEEGSIIKDLIDKAGGLKETANINNINRAEKLQANKLIIIPNINDKEQNMILESNTETDDLININTGGINELTKINGIGEAKAQNIIDYRENNGGFKTIEEIKNIDGIGDKTYEKIKNKIKV